MSVLTSENRKALDARKTTLRATAAPYLREASIPRLDDVLATRRIQTYLDCITPAFQSRQNDLAQHFEPDVGDAFNRLVLIELLDEFDPDAYVPESAPTWLHESYVARVNFIAQQIATTPVGDYAGLSEPFVKDLRILSGVSYPNNHLVVDWQAYLPKTFYRYEGWRENLRNLYFIRFAAGGLGPYLRDHIDSRFVGLRKQVGRYTTRHGNAEIMLGCPWILGVVGTSWVNDPALEWVSPHLWERTGTSYRLGAHLKRDGFNELDVERAISTSETRRRLYEQGRYRPCAYTTVWLRKDVISWHQRNPEGD